VAPESIDGSAWNLHVRLLRAQLAVRYSKLAKNRGLETDMETAIVFENQIFALCFATEDQKEGMTTFIEKRNADFICR
jgi:enoyl-CoA hydratase